METVDFTEVFFRSHENPDVYFCFELRNTDECGDNDENGDRYFIEIYFNDDGDDTIEDYDVSVDMDVIYSNTQLLKFIDYLNYYKKNKCFYRKSQNEKILMLKDYSVCVDNKGIKSGIIIKVLHNSVILSFHKNDFPENRTDLTYEYIDNPTYTFKFEGKKLDKFVDLFLLIVEEVIDYNKGEYEAYKEIEKDILESISDHHNFNKYYFNKNIITKTTKKRYNPKSED